MTEHFDTMHHGLECNNDILLLEWQERLSLCIVLVCQLELVWEQRMPRMFPQEQHDAIMQAVTALIGD